jgi:hypothetical protein
LSYNTLMEEVKKDNSDNTLGSEKDSPTNVSAGNEKLSETKEILWTASEFIAHSKSTGWYALLVLATVIACTIAFFLADIFTVVIIAIMAILFGVVAARKPRELPYKVDANGIQVDKKLYPFSSFKSFSIIQEEGIESIWFMPLQRFMPGLSIYFAPQDGQKIVNLLGEFLPYEQRKLDAVGNLMHRIRF